MEKPKPRVVVTYCRQCNWLLRSAWMAQELLSTFAEEIGEVALVPGTGGVFRIEVDGATVWERVADGGFPEIKALKQRVRDRVAPERGLGHTDRAAGDPVGGLGTGLESLANALSPDPDSMPEVADPAPDP